MKTIIRTNLVLLVFIAGSSGCSSVETVASNVGSSIGRVADKIAHPFSPAPVSKPALADLDAYKTRVAQHVLQHNPHHNFDGKLPPMLPAIVVLEITVDRDGQLAEVEVQRSRDPDASQIALASMRRSTPLPPPQHLVRADGKLKFSETFLFADSQHYQLRSLAGPQTAD